MSFPKTTDNTSAHLRSTLLACVFSALLLLIGAGSASAQTFVVDSTDDSVAANPCAGVSGDCSLRAAIELANTTSGADRIEFDPALTQVVLDSPLPPVTEQLTIDGEGRVEVVGSAAYGLSCTADDYALDASAAPLARVALSMWDLCGRSVVSSVAAPSIQIGPRRADGSLSISGSAAAGSVDIYRADAPVADGEAGALVASGVPSSGGYSHLPAAEPVPGERFTASVTDLSGSTSAFAQPATTPDDLAGPVLLSATAVANNAVRLDFNEGISPAINGQIGAVSLNMGGIPRAVTDISASFNSVWLISRTMPWQTGEAGSVALTGNGRISDVFGNEVFGLPAAGVFAGPGELVGPSVTSMRVSAKKFCRAKTRKCTKRTMTYVQFTLSKASRVVFTVMRAKGRKFVARYVHKLDRGKIKSRLRGNVNGRNLPATNLIVEVVAEDVARNLSAPASTRFKVVTSNKSF